MLPLSSSQYFSAARDGANIIIASKTANPHPRHDPHHNLAIPANFLSLPGTIYTAAKEIEDAGGRALPVVVDVRDLSQIEAAAKKGAEMFGGLSKYR